MLGGGLNQRIRENSFFFTIVYFTGSREQGEGGNSFDTKPRLEYSLIS
jgi:hypothetical protein